MIYCSLHTRTLAGWSCTACHRTLCPDCTGWRASGTGQADICMRCQGLARAIFVHRAERDPFRSTFLGALKWPLTPGGLFTLAAVAFVVHLLELAGALSGFIGYGVALAYFFQLVRHTAAGHDDVPAPEDFRGFFDDIIGPFFRALLASMWFVSPALVYLVASGSFHYQDSILTEPFHVTPVLAVLLLGGVLLYPMSIIAGALNSPFSTLLNPISIIGLTFELGSDYWLCSVFCLICSLGAGLLSHVCSIFFQAVPLPFNGFLETAISLYLPFVSFRALGLLVRARGDVLGYGTIEQYRVRILEVRPRHELLPPPDRTQELKSLLSHEPIELLPSKSAVPMPLQGPAESAAELGQSFSDGALELEPRGAISAPDAELASRLAQAMASRDLDAARKALKLAGASVPPGTLSAQSWNELARSLFEEAAKTTEPERAPIAELALFACQRSVEVAPEGNLAPRAWLSAARIADEMLGDRSLSDALLSELAKRFPSTREGGFAIKRLGKRATPA